MLQNFIISWEKSISDINYWYEKKCSFHQIEIPMQDIL